jgi:hypothetical protein
MLACRRQNVLERISTRSSHTLVLEPIRLLILLSLHKQPLELVIKLGVDLHRCVGVQHRNRWASCDVLPR